MNKIKILLLFSLFLLISTTCFASIPKEDLTMGNVSYGDNLVTVESQYGSPQRESLTTKHSLWRGVIREARYGDSFVVTYRNGNVIFLQSFSERNGIKTSKGLSVGMTKEEAVELYGEPDIKLTRRWIWESEDHTGLAISFNDITDNIFFISIGEME